MGKTALIIARKILLVKGKDFFPRQHFPPDCLSLFYVENKKKRSRKIAHGFTGTLFYRFTKISGL